MGNVSGYDCLFDTMEKREDLKLYSNFRDLKKLNLWDRKIRHPHIKKKYGQLAGYNYNSYVVEQKSIQENKKIKADIFHIAYLENNLGYLAQNKTVLGSTKLIATAHQPGGWWKFHHQPTSVLSCLDGLILLSANEVDYFKQFFPEEKIFVIPHGVKTDFFKTPTVSEQSNEKIRCVFAGAWLRDIDTLIKVIRKSHERNLNVQFDLIIPYSGRKKGPLFSISHFDNVNWHSGISNEDLASIYRESDIFILPLLNCTANNALLEAMSSGLPILINDVGAAREYTSPEGSYYIPHGEFNIFVNHIEQLSRERDKRVKMGEASRKKAEELDWNNISNLTIKAYNKVLQS